MERIAPYRLGAARVWRNPSVRRLAALLLAAAAAAALLFWLFVVQSAERLRQDWMAQQSAILGKIAAADPEAAKRWALLLAKPETLTEDDARQGRELAAQYGITSELDWSLLPTLAHYRTYSWMMLGTGLFALFALLAILLVREYRRQLAEIGGLAVSLENAVKRNEPMAFRLYGEGELGLLANSVQELAIRLQETIEQLHRDKDFLKDTIADISHQLKTPLASLIVYVELLQEGNVDPAAQREFLATCRRELDRMEWLTLTLLKIARLEAGALQLQIRPAPMADTVARAVEALARLARERQVSVAVEPSAEEGNVPHDTRWLAEAIVNLLKNAVEHSPPGSVVRVGWETTPVFLRLFVEDQGTGIEEKHLPGIFRKFYRAGAGGSGVGLGLPLAKSIVERHGGMLSASSGKEGGSRFMLTLPLHPLPASEHALPYRTVRSDNGEL